MDQNDSDGTQLGNESGADSDKSNSSDIQVPNESDFETIYIVSICTFAIAIA